MAMNITQMLAELRAERDTIDATILAIERLAGNTGPKRRGRPPKWMSDTKPEASAPAKKRGRPRKQPESKPNA